MTQPLAGLERSRTIAAGPLPALYWTLARNRRGQMEICVVHRADGGSQLPIFGLEEEAREFLSTRSEEEGWQVRQTTRGELISLLHGPCRSVREVMFGSPEGSGMSRSCFMDSLLGRERAWFEETRRERKPYTMA